MTQAQRQKMIDRAATLFTEQRYTIEPYPDRPGVYCVARPIDDVRPLHSGESLWNDVDVQRQQCTCAAFACHRVCKHTLAALETLASAARLLAPMLPKSRALETLANRPENRARGRTFV